MWDKYIPGLSLEIWRVVAKQFNCSSVRLVEYSEYSEYHSFFITHVVTRRCGVHPCEENTTDYLYLCSTSVVAERNRLGVHGQWKSSCYQEIGHFRRSDPQFAHTSYDWSVPPHCRCRYWPGWLIFFQSVIVMKNPWFFSAKCLDLIYFLWWNVSISKPPFQLSLYQADNGTVEEGWTPVEFFLVFSPPILVLIVISSILMNLTNNANERLKTTPGLCFRYLVWVFNFLLIYHVKFDCSNQYWEEPIKLFSGQCYSPSPSQRYSSSTLPSSEETWSLRRSLCYCMWPIFS